MERVCVFFFVKIMAGGGVDPGVHAWTKLLSPHRNKTPLILRVFTIVSIGLQLSIQFKGINCKVINHVRHYLRGSCY
jgi:hypothetical protein